MSRCRTYLKSRKKRLNPDSLWWLWTIYWLQGASCSFVSYIIHVYTACADPENFSSGKGKARDKNLLGGGLFFDNFILKFPRFGVHHPLYFRACTRSTCTGIFVISAKFVETEKFWWTSLLKRDVHKIFPVLTNVAEIRILALRKPYISVELAL